ncbi:hypothetical protein MRX96_003458 [Rhipicephalus microplus]
MRVAALTLLCLVGMLSARRPTSVQTSSGLVVGLRVKTGHHHHVNHFLGVPYAMPPRGSPAIRSASATG